MLSMAWLIASLAFFIIIIANWWFGLWNNTLTLINFWIAATVASGYYENLAGMMAGSMPTYEYLLDFVALWLLFFFTFAVLRGITSGLSTVRLRFNFWVDMAARSFACIWLAFSFVCFATFSLHLAPIHPTDNDVAAFAESDEDLTLAEYVSGGGDGPSFVGFGPGRLWMAYIQSRSRGALSASQTAMGLGKYDLPEHPDDVDSDCRVFDPFSRMPIKRQFIRHKLSTNESIRTEEKKRRR